MASANPLTGLEFQEEEEEEDTTKPRVDAGTVGVALVSTGWQPGQKFAQDVLATQAFREAVWHAQVGWNPGGGKPVLQRDLYFRIDAREAWGYVWQPLDLLNGVDDQTNVLDEVDFPDLQGITPEDFEGDEGAHALMRKFVVPALVKTMMPPKAHVWLFAQPLPPSQPAEVLGNVQVRVDAATQQKARAQLPLVGDSALDFENKDKFVFQNVFVGEVLVRGLVV